MSGRLVPVSSEHTTGLPQVATDLATRTVYSTDNSVYQVVPQGVALPTTPDEIAELLRDNARRAEPRPIVARGGGTGTNGQSLTDGLMVDLKRNLGRLIELDVEGRTAVVEPGMVTGQLNDTLKAHGLFWPPHTSTLNRATVGGMISTDAAGKGSLVHGRAHRHVLRLDVLLADGTPWVAEPITIAEAERRAAGNDSGAQLWRSLLDLDVTADRTFDLPELARGFSGYGVDRLRSGDTIDPTALLCGAEGTLAIITAATLKLHPLPERPRLAVAVYASFDDALEEAVRLRETGPSAIEAFDETTLDRGRSSPAWPALGAIVGDHQGAVLLLEYADPPEVAELTATIVEAGRCLEVQVTDDPADQASMWKVRADAVGLLAKVAVGGPERSARPTAFVEDCAVPVPAMPAFIRDFRQLLDDAGVVYGMFGHADVGCVHVRPALDLTHAADRERHAALTDSVTDLVHRHGGILWGEHGRGFRGERIGDILDDATLNLMRQVKTAFDPLDLLNPGKLYRPLGVSTPIIGVAEPGLRGDRDEGVPVDVRRAHDHAFSCNGNGLCQQWSAHDVMCPSYVATGDPALSPKGRADLTREWLANRQGDREFEAALVENLNHCLSCGACSGECPVAVDIPELKSQVLESIGPKGGVAALILGRFESAARLASLAPPLARPFLGVAERLTGLVDLPAPKDRRRSHRRFNPRRRGEVVILPDVFTSALEPRTLDRLVDLLERLGIEASVAPFVPSGKFDHVKGNRKRFRRAAKRQQIQLRQAGWTHSTPVVIEPAVALLHRHEYPAAIEDYPSDRITTLPELLLEHVDRIASVGDGQRVTLLGHCTERANAPDQLAAWTQVLTAAGYAVDVPKVGCCGMAGIFGHEAENQDMSHRLWELSWAEHADPADERFVVATGYSCRSQAARHGAPMRHPIDLLMNQPRRREIDPLSQL